MRWDYQCRLLTNAQLRDPLIPTFNHTPRTKFEPERLTTVKRARELLFDQARTRVFWCEAILGGHNKCRLMITPTRISSLKVAVLRASRTGACSRCWNKGKSRRRLNL